MAEAGTIAGQNPGRLSAQGGRRAPAWAGGALLVAIIHELERERDRWFLWIPILFGAGVALFFALDKQPYLIPALSLVVAALALRGVWRRGTLGVVGSGVLLCLALGFADANLRTHWVASPTLERPLKIAAITGFVELIEPNAKRGQRLTILASRIAGLPAASTPVRVRVRILKPAAWLRVGSAIELKATLAPPAKPSLPGDYDFARAAWFQSLGAVGYALSAPEPDLAPPPLPLQLYYTGTVEWVRREINRRILAVLPNETGAIACALITGERGGISEATNQAYRDAGIFHILSISGVHMAVMAGAVFFLIRFVLAALPSIALRFPIKKWAAIGGVVGGLAYLLISGAAFATQRSYIMILIGFLAILLDRRALALRNVALAAMLIMVVYPESVLDVGFQMSFACVGALISGYEALRDYTQRREGRTAERGPIMGAIMFVGGICLSTVIATAAVTPFTIYQFHQTQQYGILGNLVALPICDVLIMPLSLAVLLLMPMGLDGLPLTLMGWCIDVMTVWAGQVAYVPGAVARLPAIPDSAFASMVAGGIWLCVWRRRWRLLGLVAIALGLCLAPLRAWPDVIVGREGQLVVVRGAEGKLWAAPQRGGNFELQRWLDFDGDGRALRLVEQGSVFRCDALGCTATIKGKLIAIARSRAALKDDCARADILVLTFPSPRRCEGPVQVIDLYALRDKGTHVLFLDTQPGAALQAPASTQRATSSDPRASPGSPALDTLEPRTTMAIDTVYRYRGHHSWTMANDRATSRDGRAPSDPLRELARDQAAASRLQRFASRLKLTDLAVGPRPEVEDDDAPEAADTDQ